MPKPSDAHLEDLARRFVEQAPSQVTKPKEEQFDAPRRSTGQGAMLLALFGFGIIAVGGMVAYLILR